MPITELDAEIRTSFLAADERNRYIYGVIHIIHIKSTYVRVQACMHGRAHAYRCLEAYLSSPCLNMKPKTIVRTRMCVPLDNFACVCSRPIPFPSPPSANTTIDFQESPERDAEKFRIALSLKEHVIGFRRQIHYHSVLSLALASAIFFVFSCMHVCMCVINMHVSIASGSAASSSF